MIIRSNWHLNWIYIASTSNCCTTPSLYYYLTRYPTEWLSWAYSHFWIESRFGSWLPSSHFHWNNILDWHPSVWTDAYAYSWCLTRRLHWWKYIHCGCLCTDYRIRRYCWIADELCVHFLCGFFRRMFDDWRGFGWD